MSIICHPPHVLIPPTPAETARPARLPGARGGHPGEGAHCLLEGGDPYLGAGQVHISEIVIISSLHVTLFRILKLLGHQQAEFKLQLVASWDKEGGKFTLLKEQKEEHEQQEGGSAGEEEGSDME